MTVKKSISRQRAWQLRQLAEGKCKLCARKAELGGLCKSHYAAKREADQDYYQRKINVRTKPAKY